MLRILMLAAGVLLSAVAQAADENLTLACQGTAQMTSETGTFYDTGSFTMGLVVNLTTRTIHGFRDQFDRAGSEAQFKITEVKEAILVLHGQMHPIIDLSGFMDRMTGDMTVTATQRPPVIFSKTYTLQCRPAQRMF